VRGTCVSCGRWGRVYLTSVTFVTYVTYGTDGCDERELRAMGQASSGLRGPFNPATWPSNLNPNLKLSPTHPSGGTRKWRE